MSVATPTVVRIQDQHDVIAHDSAIHIIRTMGDSLTEGSLGSLGAPYQATLETLLGAAWAVRNAGVAGNTTAQMVARFTTDILDYDDAEYVVILGGINDICNAGADAPAVEANLQAMYSAAKATGLVAVAVTILPFKTSAVWTAPRQAVVDAVNAWILNTATDVDYRIDAYTALEDPGVPDTLLPAYADSGWLHLSAAGYVALGTAIHAGATWTPQTVARLALGATNIVLDQGVASNSIPRFAGLGLGVGTPRGALEVAGYVTLENTTTPSSGIIYKNFQRWAHNWRHPTADGYNLFLGLNAGNAVMSPAGGASSLASYNTAVGDTAITSNTTGSYNVAVGVGALYHNTTGAQNVAVGANALRANTTGVGSLALGMSALLANTTGSYSIAIGNQALAASVTVDGLVAIGNGALKSAVTASACIAIGSGALYNNTVSGGTAIGNNALNANTTGVNNTAVGANALTLNTTGGYSVAIGVSSLAENVDGAGHVAIGYGALGANTSGVGSVAIGYSAAWLNQTGNYLTAIGRAALRSSVSANNNVGVGYAAGYYETASNKLFIDAILRTNEADGRAKSLIYGVFDAEVANQKIQINGQLGVFGAPGYALDIWHGGVGLNIGGDSLAITRTDATAKYGRIGVPHYTNAQAPVCVLYGASSSAANTLYFGGGTGVQNTATAIAFFNAANTTTATGTEVMRVTNFRVGIGIASALAKLHVVQSSVTGAVPVLTVHQQDLSEELIRFIGESAADATQSLVDATNMTTPGALAGWLKIYVQDDAASGAIADGVYFLPFYAAPTA